MIGPKKQNHLLTGTVFKIQDKQFVKMQQKEQNSAENAGITIEQSDRTKVHIPDLDLQFTVASIDLQKGLECQTATSKYLILFDKAHTIEQQLSTLQQQLNQLTINRRLYSQKVQMHLPKKHSNVQFQIILQNAQYFIQVIGTRVILDSTLDFDINKFTNKLQWYNRQQWCVTFPDLNSMAQLEKIMIDVLSKTRKIDYESRYESRFEQPNSQEIYQQLFFDSVEFSSQLVQSFKQTLEIGQIKQTQQLQVFPKNYAKPTISQGQIVISPTYQYTIISKGIYLCIYTLQNKLSSHNGIFHIIKDGKKIQPRCMMLTHDQKNIVFLSSNSTVCLYNVQKSQIADEISIQSTELIMMSSSNRKIFYCISQHSVYEIECSKNLKMLRSHRFGSWRLSSLLNYNQRLLLGDENGTVRVYNTFQAKRSVNNFMTTECISHIDVSQNSSIVVACTKHRIFIFVTGNFYQRLKKEQKVSRQLTISIADRDHYKIQEYDYRVARLIFNDSCVVSFTHDILIIWVLKKVIVDKKGTEYKMLQLSQKILDVREVPGQKNLIVNLQHSLVVLTIDSII